MHSRECVCRDFQPKGLPTLPDFADLGLVAPLLGALATEGYTTPTPIQSRAIPTVLSGRDLCGIAQTGSGKTAAFALPILQRLSAAPGRPAPKSCRALVLSPTRELASQIAVSRQPEGEPEHPGRMRVIQLARRDPVSGEDPSDQFGFAHPVVGL